MQVAPKSAVESQRLQALREYELLDTAPEEAFDDLVEVASQICGVPIATVTLVDEHRQWFKARKGLTSSGSHSDIAFCPHTILGTVTLVVNDARLDARFEDNPLVTGDPHIRFYAGVPLINPQGYALGTLCVIDRKPREFEPAQKAGLEALARLTMNLIESRRVSRQLASALEQVKELSDLLPICMYCKGIRDDKGYWSQVETYFQKNSRLNFSHGICPDCRGKFYANLPSRK